MGILRVPLDLLEGLFSVVLQQLVSSRDVQDGSCLVSMLCGNSLVLAQDFPIIVVGVSCSCGRFNSPVVECKLLCLWCEVRLCWQTAPLYV